MQNEIESSEFELQVFAKPSRFAWMLLLAAALAAVCLWIGLAHTEPIPRVLGWLGFAFCLACGRYLAKRLFAPTPVLILDREGILDRASGIAVGRIAWHEIQDVIVCAVNRQKFVGIHVTDLAALGARLPRFRRAMLHVNVRLGYPPVNLPQSVLPMPAEELAAVIADQVTRRGRQSQG